MNMKKIQQTGFTLLELMVVVAMIGVISAIGIPSFKAMLVTNSVVDTTNQMIMSMKRARFEAVARGKDTIMCSSTDGATCSQVSGNWNKGWIVGVDLNASGQIDDGELIWAHDMDDDTQIKVTPSIAAFDHTVQYSFNGWIVAGDDIGFDICSGYGADGYPQREIRASIAGEPHIFKNLAVKC